MSKDQKSTFLSLKRAGLTAMACAIAVICVTTGCGSSSYSATSNAGGTTTPPPVAQTSTQIRIGDAPADRVVSFEVTIGPITMTPSGGSAVIVLPGAQRLEMTHLSGTNESLALLDVSQGTYTSATMTVANPEVTYINNLGALVKLEPSLNQAVTVNFSPALTVGSGSMVVNIDLNVANSLTFDASGNVTGVALGSTSLSLTTAAVAAEDHQGHDDGEIEDTTGTITAVNGSDFTLTVGQGGISLPFTTDAATEFNDGASLTVNTIVTVEGVTKTDGTLYAREVEGIEDAEGSELEGLITQVAGSPAAQLTIVADSGDGSGVDDTKIGSTLTADISGSKYKVSKGEIDTSGIGGLPSSPRFPFDAATVHAGQRIEVDDVNALAGTNIAAEKVKLQQQALVGTVSGLGGVTSAGPVILTLTVPGDSVFAMLSGQTQLTVYWQPGTDLHNLTNVSNGDTVRVRGLVFFTGTAFNMIARRIDR